MDKSKIQDGMMEQGGSSLSWKRVLRLILGPILGGSFLVFFPSLSGDVIPARMVGIAIWMLVWWITECVPLAVTALLPIILIPASGVAPIGEVGASYGNPLVFLFLGGFLLALGIEKWQLHRRIAVNIISWTGTRPFRILLGFALATALLSMWISNTATAVMMLPIATSVVALVESKAGERPKFAMTLFLVLAWAANIGGMMTLIGTPPNLILAGFSDDNGLQPITFSMWMMIGFPIGLMILAGTIGILALRSDFHFPVREEDLSRLFEMEKADLGSLKGGEKRVLWVFALTALAWILRKQIVDLTGWEALTDTTIALISGISLFIIPSGQDGHGVLQWKDTERLPWGILVLFGGGLALAFGLDRSGVLDILEEFLKTLPGFTPFGYILLATAMGVYLTEFLSNMALTAALLPVILAISTAVDIEFLALAIPLTLGSSCAFMFPMATPPNAVVFSSQRLTVAKMAGAGFWVNLWATTGISLGVWLLYSNGLLS
ncbi:MAG: DASS family sodium-coupled anion symporter [Bacteroidota bacterium]|nr:DASS family sodium-coupled anion symporter [Bacteroidota bacterium]